MVKKLTISCLKIYCSCVEDSGCSNKSRRDEVYRAQKSLLPRRNWASFGKMSSITKIFFLFTMAITKSRKEEQLAALTVKFKDASGVAFAKFDQLGVEEAQVIRRELRANGMSYTVIKKTLMAIAAKDAGLAEFDSDQLEGSVAVIVSADDAVMPAQFIKKFKKDFFVKKTKDAAEITKVDFAGSLFEGNFLDAAATAEFANTATREESLAKIVGMLKSGPQKLHGVFNSGFQGLYNVMQNADKFAA